MISDMMTKVKKPEDNTMDVFKKGVWKDTRSEKNKVVIDGDLFKLVNQCKDTVTSDED